MKNIKVSVHCLPPAEKNIKKLFFLILEDYCKRFNVKVTDKKVNVSICLVEYSDITPGGGLTVYEEDGNKILIQMRDPWLNNWEDNGYMYSKFADIMCHEFVHACQNLTGRKGFKVKGLTYDKTSEREVYYFDPEEMEARMLEGPYSELYAQDLL
jgi:hypothetical protein